MITFLILFFVFISGVLASNLYSASEIIYTREDNSNINTVEDAINELYSNSKRKIILYENGVFNPDYTYNVEATNTYFSKMDLKANEFSITADVSGYTSIIWDNINIENYTLKMNCSLMSSVLDKKYMSILNKSGEELIRFTSSKSKGVLSYDNASGFSAVAETGEQAATNITCSKIWIEY